MLVDLRKGEHKAPEFLKLNPGGKVPVLMDGDLVLSESAAICTHVGERFPASGLVPPLTDPSNRASYFQWCFFAMSELEAPLWAMTKHTRLMPEERRVAAIAPTCIWEFEKAAKILAQHMEGREYAVGSQFTAADILLGGTLNWGKSLEIALPTPSLEAYAERMAAHPALLKAKERGM